MLQCLNATRPTGNVILALNCVYTYEQNNIDVIHCNSFICLLLVCINTYNVYKYRLVNEQFGIKQYEHYYISTSFPKLHTSETH